MLEHILAIRKVGTEPLGSFPVTEDFDEDAVLDYLRSEEFLHSDGISEEELLRKGAKRMVDLQLYEVTLDRGSGHGIPFVVHSYEGSPDQHLDYATSGRGWGLSDIMRRLIDANGLKTFEELTQNEDNRQYLFMRAGRHDIDDFLVSTGSPNLPEGMALQGEFHLQSHRGSLTTSATQVYPAGEYGVQYSAHVFFDGKHEKTKVPPIQKLTVTRTRTDPADIEGTPRVQRKVEEFRINIFRSHLATYKCAVSLTNSYKLPDAEFNRYGLEVMSDGYSHFFPPTQIALADPKHRDPVDLNALASTQRLGLEPGQGFDPGETLLKLMDSMPAYDPASELVVPREVQHSL